MASYVQSLRFSKTKWTLAEALEGCSEMGLDLCELQVSETPSTFHLSSPDAKLKDLRMRRIAPGLYARVGDSRRTPNPILLPLANLVIGAAGIYGAVKGIGP